MSLKAKQDIRRKLKVLNYAKEIGNVSKACRYYGVSRESYYQWKRGLPQANAIKLIDYVVKRFPFRIRTIRTDNGHEFQSKFHWHVEDLGMEHVYIKPGTPRLNGKVECSHLTDKHEFYQLLDYKGDVDLEEKLTEWAAFYNLDRPRGAHGAKTPYEMLKEKMAA